MSVKKETLKVIDTVAAFSGSGFKKENFTDGYIRLSGYSTPGDNGGGILYVDTADTTSSGNGYSVFVTGSGVRLKRPLEDHVNIQWFGPFDNTITNWAPRIEQAAAAAVAAKKTLVLPKVPGGSGYPVTRTVNLPAQLSIDAQDRIYLTANLPTSPVVVYGQAGVASQHQKIKFNLVYRNFGLEGTFLDDQFTNVSLIFQDVLNSIIEFDWVFNSTTAVSCRGMSSLGFAYNVFTLGIMSECRNCIQLYAGGTDGWTNENVFIGGAFLNQDPYLLAPSQAGDHAVGIHVTSVGTSPRSQNCNRFYSPGFEIGGNGTRTDSVLVQIDSSCRFLKVMEARNESATHKILVVNHALSVENEVHCLFDYDFYEPSDAITDLSDENRNIAWTTSWESAYGFRNMSSYSTGQLGRIANQYDGAGRVYVPGVYWRQNTSNVTSLASNNPDVNIGANGIYIETSNPAVYDLEGPALFVDVRDNRSIVFKANSITGFLGRYVVVCYDSNMTQLSGTSPKYVNGGIGLASNASFGGSYVALVDSEAPLYLRFHPSVAFAELIYTGGNFTTRVRICSLTVRGCDGGVVSVGSKFRHNDAVTNRAVATPTTKGFYEKGQIIYNNNKNVAGDPVGWVNTVTGAAASTSWLSFN